MSEGYFKPYDLKTCFEGEEITFEVKADRLAKRSNNIAIEYECKNKASGICTTEADYWVYFIVGTPTYFIIPTTALRDAIKEQKYKMKITANATEFKNKLYLFGVDTFEEYKHVHSEVL